MIVVFVCVTELEREERIVSRWKRCCAYKKVFVVVPSSSDEPFRRGDVIAKCCRPLQANDVLLAGSRGTANLTGPLWRKGYVPCTIAQQQCSSLVQIFNRLLKLSRLSKL